MMGSQKNSIAAFGMILKIFLLSCFVNLRKQRCVSQRQTIIKLLEKPNKDKRFVANWGPISLLNFDLKIISESLATRLKNVLGKIIYARQTAYVNERFIGESGRLIVYLFKMFMDTQVI